MQRVFLIPFVIFGCTSSSPGVQSASKQNEPVHVAKAAQNEKPEPKPVKKRPKTISQTDLGVFEEHNGLPVAFPSWLGDISKTSIGASGQTSFVYVDGTAVGLDSEPTIEVSDFGDDDVDGDGIPNQIDILLGAKKADLNDAAYGSPYRKLDYPNGDVPTEEGVCTDVVIRAVRNAGIDLQKELHEDIKKSRKSYRMVKRPDPNIDQRRVKTMLPYFKRQWTSLPTTFKGHEQTWLPGDIVFMQTMGDKRPDHVGIVSDRVGASGAPVIINNWTNGYSTDELDLVEWVPITHRFRWTSRPRLPDNQRRLLGVLNETGHTLPSDVEQLIVVTSGAAKSAKGELRLLQKTDDTWEVELGPYEVALGSAGMKPGLGIDSKTELAKKREGDLASPSGLFLLGGAFGSKPPPKKMAAYSYLRITDEVWVDDPKSELYNQQQETPNGAWKSAENLNQYDRAILIEHNFEKPVPGFGSAIFLHSTTSVDQPTLGCTALPLKQLDRLLSKLEDKKNPALLQAPVWWNP